MDRKILSTVACFKRFLREGERERKLRNEIGNGGADRGLSRANKVGSIYYVYMRESRAMG